MRQAKLTRLQKVTRLLVGLYFIVIMIILIIAAYVQILRWLKRS